jgi:hypothetical protein
MAQQVIEASTRTPGRNRGRSFHPPNDSRTGADALGSARISRYVKYAFTRAIIVLIGFGTVWMSSPPSATADPSGGDAKQESTGSQTTPDESESTNNGSDLTRPQNALEMRFSDETSSNDTSETNRARMLLRVTSKISFNADWRLALLAQVPLVEEATTTFDPFSMDHEFGLGDAAFQTVLARAINERWAVGIGARLVARTADDDLGSGKWQIMPGFGVRYLIPEWGPDSYFVPAVRYAMSFAGDSSSRRISEPQIAPTLNIDLPSRWFLTFYPSYDIRINFGAPKAGQTGRLFLPFDALAGVKLTDNLEISLEVGVPIVKAYPVYNFKTEARVRVSF